MKPRDGFGNGQHHSLVLEAGLRAREGGGGGEVMVPTLGASVQAL